MEPEFERVRAGEAFAIGDCNLPLERDDYLEDCWFNFTYSPIRELNGRVGGLLAVVTETTSRVEDERRLATLRDLARRSMGVKSLEQVCRNVARVFELNRLDLPFALLYLLDEDGSRARRAASVGLSRIDVANVTTLASNDSNAWPVFEVARTGRPVVLKDLRDRFGWVSGGGPSEAAHTAMLLPLNRSGRHPVRGVLVLGVSPRRHFDRRYSAFFELASHQIATSLDAARGFEEQSRRANAFSRMDRLKSKALTDVSHELRTPVALLLGRIADVLSGSCGSLTESQRRELELARHQGIALQNLADCLLDVARLGAAYPEARFEPVDLAELTAEWANLFGSSEGRDGLRLIVECEPLPEPIYVDRFMWKGIVSNLLFDAFKVAFQNEIRLRLRRTEGGAELSVGQSPGVAAPLRAGIGLPLVEELVRIHGGSVSTHNEPSQGSIVRVTLPRGYAHLPKDQLVLRGTVDGGPRLGSPVGEKERWLPDPNRNSPVRSGQGARILVAEDNADMCFYLRRVLSEHWVVETVRDGIEAIAAVRREPPDLIVADVAMPGLDGFALLRTLRAEPSTRWIPCILLSARGGERCRVEGLDAGALDYFVKPFNARELVSSVASGLSASRARREAEAANQAKDAFLALLGHELRNPLAPIITALELMKLKNTQELERERNVIERQVRHMVQLVDDLLDVSRVTRGKIQLRLEPIEISAVIAQAIETVNPLLEQRRHTLSVSVPRSGLQVKGDPFRLSQVFANLLTNAAKYTAPDGEIAIRASLMEGQVLVSIADNGTGIPHAMLNHIFEPFVQGERSKEGSSGGLGLGLPLVRSLVALHEGKVRAKSEGAGRGSEFTVELPALVTEPSEAEKAAESEPRDATHGERRRLLVVDDNADAAEMIAEGLRVLGYDVRVAYDGKTALALAAEFRPEFAVLDIGLPVLDGYELGAKLRDILGEQLVLVAVTGYAQPGDRERSRRAHFREHLVKPIDLRLLVRALQTSVHST